MRTGGISTYALQNAARIHTNNLQEQLAEAQKEVATGRKADLGYSLGSRSSTVVSVEYLISSIEQTKITNSFVENRMSTMQLSMQSIVDQANDFISIASVELNSNLEKGLLASAGASALGAMTSSLNITLGGEYLFSGVNSDSPAIRDYQNSNGSTAKSAVQAAFATEFGFSVNDPAAASITPVALKSFIDGAFDELFNDTNWQSLWSNSSERGMRSKISTRELIENPITANVSVFRKVTAAAVLLEEFANGNLNSSTLNELANSSIETMAESIHEMGIEQSRLGILENRVSSASTRMDFPEEYIVKANG